MTNQEPASEHRPRRKKSATRSTRGAPARVRLRPQNPFDLIRLLARTQTDPRKALAELVQNSLDAGARRVELTWFNEKGRRALRIWDDGGGVFPELEREEALRRIAKTIGHSHKRDMTPMERRDQLVLGQYGIGLIGFWCVAEVMEIKSRVAGGPAVVLRLREDHADGEVFTSRSRLLDEDETFTEITLRGVHEGAQARIRPPRLQAYLATELRGQLLERGATLSIRDRVARGRARKHFIVEPQPYLGQRLEQWQTLEVPGFEDARLELYEVAAAEDRRGVVALSCGGAIVMDDITFIDGDESPRSLWAVGDLEGIIDFPELYVPPATRRGFVHDEPVTAFLTALDELEQELGAHFEEQRERRRMRKREHLARDIRRAFTSVVAALPEYDFFAVRVNESSPHPSAAASSEAEEPSESAPAEGAGAVVHPPDGTSNGDLPPAADAPSTTAAVPEPRAVTGEPPQTDRALPPNPLEEEDEPGDEVAMDSLFPPGPLAELRVQPKSITLAPLASRRLRARTLDADGRPCAGEVDLSWHLDGEGQLSPEGSRAIFTAPESRAPGGPATSIELVARQGDVVLRTRVPVRLRTDATGRLGAVGIPEPRPVSAPGESWRSRLVGRAWEYNDAHRDFLAVADVEARRLRYLIHLFVKEIVLRNFGGPADAAVLERMVEVLTHLDLDGRK